MNDENDYGSPMFRAMTKAEVPKGMKNYLTKWCKFGEAFRELIRDRPTIMITDDHDVFANDLWGRGGVRMNDNRMTGGQPRVTGFFDREPVQKSFSNSNSEYTPSSPSP